MTFHILSGGSTEGTFRHTGIEGDHIAWREDLMTGATPRGLSRDEWLTVRSEQLSSAFGLDSAACRAELAGQERKLAKSLAADEIFLWFEYDLFCQINLVYLLDWYQIRSGSSVRLMIPPFEAIVEQGLGTLEPDQLMHLFENRQETSASLKSLGIETWAAYSSADPRDLVKLLQTDISALPFLQRSLRSHLSRFPSTENGLGRVEGRALALIASGKNTFRALFPEFADKDGAFGYGDAHLFIVLRQLVNCQEPLLISNVADLGAMRDNDFLDTSYQLTSTGADVLAGNKDEIRLNGIDRWLGGVHLTSNNCWRWDESRQTIVSGT